MQIYVWLVHFLTFQSVVHTVLTVNYSTAPSVLHYSLVIRIWKSWRNDFFIYGAVTSVCSSEATPTGQWKCDWRHNLAVPLTRKKTFDTTTMCDKMTGLVSKWPCFLKLATWEASINTIDYTLAKLIPQKHIDSSRYRDFKGRIDWTQLAGWRSEG